MHRRRLYQPYIAIDPAARIPPGRIGRIVQADGDHVLAAEFDVGRQIDSPRGVAVGPAADVLTVEPDIGVGHRSVHVQVELPTLIAGRHGEVLAIPTDAEEGQLARAARGFGIERTFDPPVVRER